MATNRQKAAAASARSERKHAEDLLDEALRDTFPASDPISLEVLRDEEADFKLAKHKTERSNRRGSPRHDDSES